MKIYSYFKYVTYIILRPHTPVVLGFNLGKIIAAAIFVVVHIEVAAALEQAQPTGLPAGTSLVCTGEQAIGFRWVKGRWKSTDFVPNRYLIEKRAAGQARTTACRDISHGAVSDAGRRTAVLYGCYIIRRDGDAEEGAEQVCLERWKSIGSRWVLDEVACDNFRFLPDGWFHRTSLHGELSTGPPNDEKDPLSVSVGHCRLR
ncbi:hypothetical protein JT06_04055 [Desulfobulbus sp. Tol-SR]|jgi:hypothetical protein|nr:hypothetical protein JT06_04055 [Desulfobulbus sp. Tol-SR]